MRNAENNEIDLLLRSLAQRESDAPGNTANTRLGRDEHGNHLDADELSSFAEGVLPAAARSLYAAHLADCSRCRRIVAQLAAASGAAVRPVSSEASRSRWWSNIIGFFTPAILRYGVPAMSLVILSAIGLVWFRQTRQEGSVARVNQPASKLEPREFDNQGGLSVQKMQESVGRTNNSKTAATVPHETARDEEKPKTKTEAAVADSVEREQARTEQTTDLKDVAALPSPTRSDDANTAFSPRPAKAMDEESKRQALAKQRQAPAAPTVVPNETERNNREDKDDSANKKAEARRVSEPAATRAGGKLMGATTGSTASATRTVAGRHFRRLNNAWVDTAYDSSAQTTTLTRGSEQYRALAGDEPGLRAIAEQLDGEVIVVWKGRAYRIR